MVDGFLAGYGSIVFNSGPAFNNLLQFIWANTSSGFFLDTDILISYTESANEELKNLSAIE